MRRTLRSRLLRLALRVLCSTAGTPALAQLGVPQDGPIRGEWEALTGLAVTNGAAYLGSSERKTRALPLVALRWRNGATAGTDGLGLRFGAGGDLAWGLRLSLDPGRDQDDAAALRGMGDVPLRPEIGAFATYRPHPALTLGSSFRYGSGEDRSGLKWDLSARTMYPVSPGLRLMAGATLTFGNRSHMQTQFGVTESQAAASGYRVFSPGAGVRDLGLLAGGLVQLGPDTTLMLGLNVQTLFGETIDSPLYRQRTSVGVVSSIMVRF